MDRLQVLHDEQLRRQVGRGCRDPRSDGSVDPAVAAHDDVHDPSHVLTGAAANAFAEDRGEYLCRR